jgi:hypothetical protein
LHVHCRNAAQTDLAALLNGACQNGVPLNDVYLAFAHRITGGCGPTCHVQQAVFDALPFHTLEKLSLEEANANGALQLALEAQLATFMAIEVQSDDAENQCRNSGFPLRRLHADLTDDVIGAATRFFPHLRVLQLMKTFSWASCFHVDSLAQHCRALEVLILGNDENHADAGHMFHDVTANAHFYHLRMLSVYGWYYGEPFNIIAPALRTIDMKLGALGACEHSRQQQARAFARECSRCEREYTRFEAQIWEDVVAKCPKLTRVRTCGTTSPHNFVAVMKKLSKLKWFSALDVEECGYEEVFGTPTPQQLTQTCSVLRSCAALRRVKLLYYNPCRNVNVATLRRISEEIPTLHLEVGGAPELMMPQ